jgi:hypothetical protein
LIFLLGWTIFSRDEQSILVGYILQRIGFLSPPESLPSQPQDAVKLTFYFSTEPLQSLKAASKQFMLTYSGY